MEKMHEHVKNLPPIWHINIASCRDSSGKSRSRFLTLAWGNIAHCHDLSGKSRSRFLMYERQEFVSPMQSCTWIRMVCRDVRLISCDHCPTIYHAAHEKNSHTKHIHIIQPHVLYQKVVGSSFGHGHGGTDRVMPPKHPFCSWSMIRIGQVFAWWWK